MHPKNSTPAKVAQVTEDPLGLFTVHRSTFWGAAGREMFQLCLNIEAGAALKEASSLLAGVLSITEELGDNPGGANGNAMFIIRFALEGAKALLDGGTYGVEFGSRQGGDQ